MADPKRYFVGVFASTRASYALVSNYIYDQVWAAEGDPIPYHQFRNKRHMVGPFIEILDRVARDVPGINDAQELLAQCAAATLSLPGVYHTVFRDEAIKYLLELDVNTSAFEIGTSVIDDCEAVLLANSKDGNGIAIICGDGFAIYGRGPDGTHLKRDGWGPLLGDSGSGFELGMDALRAIIDNAGSDLPSSDTDVLWSFVHGRLSLDFEDPILLITWINSYLANAGFSQLRMQINQVASAVLEAADLGDQLGVRLVDSCIERCVHGVQQIRNAVAIPAGSSICVEGWLPQDSKYYRSKLLERLSHDHLDLDAQFRKVHPAWGSLTWACAWNGKDNAYDQETIRRRISTLRNRELSALATVQL